MLVEASLEGSSYGVLWMPLQKVLITAVPAWGSWSSAWLLCLQPSHSSLPLFLKGYGA